MLTDFYQTIPLSILGRVKNLDLNIPSKNCNKEVNDLLQRTVLVGGKRLRPLLTYLMGNLFGLSPDQLDPYAKSIEMVHAASLAHDDVVDNATTRRGHPSINIVASNKKAVLAGDYLLSDVIVQLTREGNLDLVREMSLVIQELSEGEWIQLDASESRQYSRDLIQGIALKKTSSVMSWCCYSPAYVAGFSSPLIEYCRSFGSNLGLAFQLMDDTLDFSGTSNKDHHLDLQNGVVNSVVFEWLALNPELLKKFEKGEDILSIWDEKNLDQAIKIVETRALNALDKAREILGIISKEMPSRNPKEVERALKPIEMILSYLANRKF